MVLAHTWLLLPTEALAIWHMVPFGPCYRLESGLAIFLVNYVFLVVAESAVTRLFLLSFVFRSLTFTLVFLDLAPLDRLDVLIDFFNCLSKKR